MEVVVVWGAPCTSWHVVGRVGCTRQKCRQSANRQRPPCRERYRHHRHHRHTTAISTSPSFSFLRIACSPSSSYSLRPCRCRIPLDTSRQGSGESFDASSDGFEFESESKRAENKYSIDRRNFDSSRKCTRGEERKKLDYSSKMKNGRVFVTDRRKRKRKRETMDLDDVGSKCPFDTNINEKENYSCLLLLFCLFIFFLSPPTRAYHFHR